MAEQARPNLSCDEVRDLAAPFVLDALEPAEMAQVREHLATCPWPHPELAELGSVLPALGRSVAAVQPPAALGARILAAARAEAAAGGAEPAAAGSAAEMPVAARRRARVPALAEQPRPAGRAAEPRRPVLVRLRSPQWVLVAAAVLAIAVLGAWNVQLQGQVGELGTYRNGVAAVLDTAAASGGHIAFLQSASGAGPTGIAAVDPGGRLVLAVRNLPPTTGSQVYEAWVIGSAGPPVPAGSFTVGGAETGTLQVAIGANPGSVAVAITREPGPGATTPTLPIIVQGQPAGA